MPIPKDVLEDVGLEQRLAYLEEERPRLLLELLRKGPEALDKDLTQKVEKAQELRATLADRGRRSPELDEIVSEMVLGPPPPPSEPLNLQELREVERLLAAYRKRLDAIIESGPATP